MIHPLDHELACLVGREEIGESELQDQRIRCVLTSNREEELGSLLPNLFEDEPSLWISRAISAESGDFPLKRSAEER